MAAHLPPIPPKARSPKGPGDTSREPNKRDPRAGPDPNLAEQGESGNLHQNTTNTGYQQDR